MYTHFGRGRAYLPPTRLRINTKTQSLRAEDAGTVCTRLQPRMHDRGLTLRCGITHAPFRTRRVCEACCCCLGPMTVGSRLKLAIYCTPKPDPTGLALAEDRRTGGSDGSAGRRPHVRAQLKCMQLLICSLLTASTRRHQRSTTVGKTSCCFGENLVAHES